MAAAAAAVGLASSALSAAVPAPTTASATPGARRQDALRGGFLRGQQPAVALRGQAAAPLVGSCGARSTTARAGLLDFIGGDYIRPDTDRFMKAVEEEGAVGCWVPAEGGVEGRYVNRLKGLGYYIMNMTARGFGDIPSYLTKTHGRTPPHLGKQPLKMFYYPAELDSRLAVLPPNKKGIVLWLIEGKVLSRAELQYLALLPTLRPEIKVVVEIGTSRNFEFQPLKDVAAGPVGARGAPGR
eukprot:jgi/Chlat1/4081/Chrsp26S04127